MVRKKMDADVAVAMSFLGDGVLNGEEHGDHGESEPHAHDSHREPDLGVRRRDVEAREADEAESEDQASRGW